MPFPWSRRGPHELEHRPAFIAGVTNPIFESSRAWDLLFDISSGNVTIAKDILATYPVATPALGTPPITRSGTLKTETSVGSETDFERKEGTAIITNSDKIFIEDVGNLCLSRKARIPLAHFFENRFGLQLRTILAKDSSVCDSRSMLLALYDLHRATRRRWLVQPNMGILVSRLPRYRDKRHNLVVA